jgi:hypothetical protein
MAEIADDIREAIGEVFDILRGDVFLDASDTMTLVKPSGTANSYSDIVEITGKWWVEYDDRRKSPKLMIADNADEIEEAMAEATHFKVNDTVYAIDKGSTIPPIGASTMWTVYGERQPKRGQFVDLW